MINIEKQLENLNAKSISKRQKALKNIIKNERELNKQVSVENNVIPLHFTSTAYFSKYSPTMCAYIAHRSNCYGVGINDYATLSYNEEFRKACKLLNLKYSCGYHIECEPLFGEKRGIVYGYGIPSEFINDFSKKMEYYSLKKKQEVINYLAVLNKEIESLGIKIKLSKIVKDAKIRNGIITEKHLANELSLLLVEKYGKTPKILEILKDNFNIESEKANLFLGETENAYYLDDLSKILYEKYILNNVEKTVCKVQEIVKLNSEFGTITSYLLPYDHFDKEKWLKAIDLLKGLGVNAITIKASKLSKEDYESITELLLDNDLLPIPLNRLGLPRQMIPQEEKHPLNFDINLSVIGNTISSSCDVEDSFFGKRTISKFPDIKKRIELFANIGRLGN